MPMTTGRTKYGSLLERSRTQKANSACRSSTLSSRTQYRAINTDLHYDGEAAAKGVHFLFPVELHHRLVHALPVVPVTLLQGHHSGLQFAHARHGAVTGRGETIKEDFHQQRQQNDGDAPVPRKPLQPDQDDEQHFGDEP